MVFSGEQRYQAGFAVERLCVVAVSSSALLACRRCPLVGVMVREAGIALADLIRPAQVAFGVFDPALLEILLEPKGDGDEKPQDVRRHLRDRRVGEFVVRQQLHDQNYKAQTGCDCISGSTNQNDS